METIVFIDIEVGSTDQRIHDIGAVSTSGAVLHTGKTDELVEFLGDTRFICGHNLVRHDLKYLSASLAGKPSLIPIDTLYISPLLFPKRPYHKLLKDDKLQTDELNNPVNDCKKAMTLFNDEIDAFRRLPAALQGIFYDLLHDVPEFRGFFEYIHYSPAMFSGRKLFGLFRSKDLGIREFFDGQICAHADVSALVRESPVALAYALALIHAGDSLSIVPPWAIRQFPQIYNIIYLLRNRPCDEGCPYCKERLNPVKALQKFFGYPSYRTYNGEPLQERAVEAAISGESLLVVFPTGGGKSVTFQVPALLSGENAHGLTVVISPLQSLMKDQVDNLKNAGITGAVTVNGLLSPVERADAYSRIADGSASLLYISPEMFRSKTIEGMLLHRNVVRFVIDEAHCFSAWGQDFRIDYLYIGDFIRKLQHQKGDGKQIAVSCFTATAKQKVISDICQYFKEKLNLDLTIYASNAARQNLTYKVLYKESDEEKYIELRTLIERKNCPTIVYVSRTMRTLELAKRLTADGIPARPFNGKMSPKEKVENQEGFIRNDFNVIVATSAFGMGVDKSDVGLVVHFDISDSLENYMQESGRAGRDQTIEADCYVLYNDSDLDKHFILLNQTKISMSDIQQVWQAIKRMTGTRKRICCSALEIARMAGWDSSVAEIETRVRTAIASLETNGYIRRGNNMPRLYATGIMVRNYEEASRWIDQSMLLTDESQRKDAKRIIKSLISSRSVYRADKEDAESRVDYLGDILGIRKADVINLVNLMREDGLLADSMDMEAYIQRDDTMHRTQVILERFAKLENFILSKLNDNQVCEFNLKELNAEAEEQGVPLVNVKNIRTVLYFLTIKHYIRKEEYKGTSQLKVVAQMSLDKLQQKSQQRIQIGRFIIDELYHRLQKQQASPDYAEHSGKTSSESPVGFSVVALYNKFRIQNLTEGISQDDVQDALLYLSTIGAVRLEGGFLVVYNGMEINRLVMDNRIRYKQEDYASLKEYYLQKVQQIHLVGAFANMMVKDYQAALQFVNDYFQMDYRKFVNHYFESEQIERLNRNMTSQRYQKLFGCLSPQQKAIIDDNECKHIVVVAGPGSGKTRVLVHKLAAMLTLDDVKHEQLLMVTFSRAAATEFKMRLQNLIGNAAHFVEIKTFHSYCFDLLGRIGNLEDSGNVVKRAVEMIRAGEVEPERISKSVLVIDEAQDMDRDEFELVCALIAVNDGMRVIAVGDDDQNIYGFRGSDSRYMRSLITDYEARMYELVENYRSKSHIVQISNALGSLLHNRLKNREIVAVSADPGQVDMVRYTSHNLEEPLVNQLKQNAEEGSVCVMASTNDEVSRLLGLLINRGIHAKLIQSIEGFSLYNLAEVRYFLKKLQPKHTAYSGGPQSLSPIISDEEWASAKEQLQHEYHDSSCLENCMAIFTAFETVNPKKYRSDLEEFIRESKFEDFYHEEKGTVFVSTIHKTKGREFDHVYLMLDRLQIRDDADLRKLYVGMTRARTTLHVHYADAPVIDSLSVDYVCKRADTNTYAEPDEIVLQLSHKDVFLHYFKEKKREILHLHSGCALLPETSRIDAFIDGHPVPVVRYSKSFVEKLQYWASKGYQPTRAEVRFVVAWRAEDDPNETAVLLPDIYLKKQHL